MPDQTIALPTARYFGRDVSTVEGLYNKRGWDWFEVVTDPAIDDDLTPSGNPDRYLKDIALWRKDNERFILFELEHITGSAGIGEGDDLSDAYEATGSITITLSGGASITGRQVLSADTTETYRFEPGEGFTTDEFDAFWDAMSPNDAEQAGTLTIRDYDFKRVFGSFGGRNLTGAAFGGRKLVGAAYGGRKFSV